MFHIAVQQQQRLGCIGLSLLLLSVSNEWLLPWLLVLVVQLSLIHLRSCRRIERC